MTVNLDSSVPERRSRITPRGEGELQTAEGQVAESDRPDASYFVDNKLNPLPKLRCGNTDCNNGLHCFRHYIRKRQKTQHLRPGSCSDCGVELVDWGRFANCRVDLIDEKFAQMQSEWVRHYYWHAKIDDHAKALAYYRGRTKLETMLRAQIQSKVATLDVHHDHNNTPYKGDPLNYARHATASCCRYCIEYWHGITRDASRQLNASEVDYLVELGVRYLRERLPDLPDEPNPAYRKKPERSRGRRRAAERRVAEESTSDSASVLQPRKVRVFRP